MIKLGALRTSVSVQDCSGKELLQLKLTIKKNQIIKEKILVEQYHLD